jgi:anion-transporting  ArsA/GET3 family ATPase
MNAWKNGASRDGVEQKGEENGGSGNVELLIVAGKGGVGKTTVAASLARNAADTGVDVLVIDVEGKRGIASAFQATSLGYAEIELSPPDPELGRGRIVARTVTPDDALVEWLGDHGLARLAKRMVSTGLVDVIATATPGIRDLLVLAKVKQLVNTHTNGLVILDTPASGHAITFLQSPSALVRAVNSGPIRRQADETPVNEVCETAFALEDRIGIALGPIVVNGLLPLLPAVEPTTVATITEDLNNAEIIRTLSFLERRVAGQQFQIQRLAKMLPLPQLHLPLLAASPFGPEHLAELAPHLNVEISPTITTSNVMPNAIWSMTDRTEGLVREPGQHDAAIGEHGLHTAVADALVGRRVILCCGPGGVGKTTTAAAIALAAAQDGKRAVVVTIDPARRLADALGLRALTNRPSCPANYGP